jgi:hypothetical protein
MSGSLQKRTPGFDHTKGRGLPQCGCAQYRERHGNKKPGAWPGFRIF